MARPKLKHKLQRNGDSIKYYENGAYVGSLPIRVLGQIIRERRNSDPPTQMTQKEPREDPKETQGFDPEKLDHVFGQAPK